MSVEARTTKTGKTRYLARVRSGEVLVASKTFGRKSDAEAWEREQKHLLDTGRPLPPKRNFTLGELVGMFLLARKSGNPHTVDTDRNNLASLPQSLLARPLVSIQASDATSSSASPPQRESSKSPDTPRTLGRKSSPGACRRRIRVPPE